MKLVTGNDLASGDVVWWDGAGWSRQVDDAVDAGDQAESIAAREEAARRVNTPYVTAADRSETGVRPTSLKDRIRATGPTVRLDLTRGVADKARGEWVI